MSKAIPLLFLATSILLFIYADKVYNFFIEMKYDGRRLFYGDNAEKPHLLIRKEPGITIIRAFSILYMLFSLFMLWFLFVSESLIADSL